MCDILRRGDVASAIQCVPGLTWILFLRVLDELEDREALVAAATGVRFEPSLKAPYRWKDWAAPEPKGAPAGWGNRRKRLTEAASKESLNFANADLTPHLKALRDKPQATAR